MRFDKMVVIGLLVLLATGATLPNVSSNGTLKESDFTLGTTLEEGQLLIDGNDDWNNSGWSGNGTESFPYLVENLTLTQFRINNSDVFFKVQNCICETTAGLVNVSNGIIQNSTFIDTMNLDTASQIQLINNTFHPVEHVEYTRVGLYILNSDIITVTDCIFSSWEPYGIKVDTSTKCTIERNSISNCGMYVVICTGDDCTSEQPYGSGLNVDSSVSCSILNNSFSDNIGRGFHIVDSEYITITDNHEVDNGSCTSIDESSDCLIANNTLHKLYLSDSFNLTIHRNSIGSGGLYVAGYLSDYMHNVTQNTVVEKPLLYVVNEHDTIYNNSEFGQVFIVNSTQVSLTKIQSILEVKIVFSHSCKIIEANCSAISVPFSTDTEIAYSKLSGEGVGVYCRESPGTWIHHNSFSHVIEGIFLNYFSPNCVVSYNTIANASKNGINVGWESDLCVVKNNTIIDSSTGIVVYSHNNTIANNTVADNEGYGILVYGNINLIYLNNLTMNLEDNGRSNGEGNQWDNGVDSGNYWGDWDGSAVYNVPGSEGCIDRYPMGEANTTTGTEIPEEFDALILVSIGSIVIITVAVIWIWKFKRKPV